MRERTIDTASIRDKSIVVQFVHKVLKSCIRDREQLGFNKTFYNPVTIPVILFSEPSTWWWLVPWFTGASQSLHEPGTTKVWLRGMKVLWHLPLNPQTADELVPRMSWVQKVWTVCAKAFGKGNVTLLRKDGESTKSGNARTSNSRPSPMKSSSKKLTIWPYVGEEIFWKSASTAWALLLVGCKPFLNLVISDSHCKILPCPRMFYHQSIHLQRLRSAATVERRLSSSGQV